MLSCYLNVSRKQDNQCPVNRQVTVESCVLKIFYAVLKPVWYRNKGDLQRSTQKWHIEEDNMHTAMCQWWMLLLINSSRFCINCHLLWLLYFKLLTPVKDVWYSKGKPSNRKYKQSFNNFNYSVVCILFAFGMFCERVCVWVCVGVSPRNSYCFYSFFQELQLHILCINNLVFPQS